jgi:hypothetical protein
MQERPSSWRNNRIADDKKVFPKRNRFFGLSDFIPYRPEQAPEQIFNFSRWVTSPSRAANSPSTICSL